MERIGEACWESAEGGGSFCSPVGANRGVGGASGVSGVSAFAFWRDGEMVRRRDGVMARGRGMMDIKPMPWPMP